MLDSVPSQLPAPACRKGGRISGAIKGASPPDTVVVGAAAVPGWPVVNRAVSTRHEHAGGRPEQSPTLVLPGSLTVGKAPPEKLSRTGPASLPGRRQT